MKTKKGGGSAIPEWMVESAPYWTSGTLPTTSTASIGSVAVGSGFYGGASTTASSAWSGLGSYYKSKSTAKAWASFFDPPLTNEEVALMEGVVMDEVLRRHLWHA